MRRPSVMAVAIAIFTAGICNAIIYTLLSFVIGLVQTMYKGSEQFTVGSLFGTTLTTLIFSLFLSSIVTFIIGFPIGAICLKIGAIKRRTFVIAALPGAVVLAALASAFSVATTTYVGILAFSFITAGIVWLSLGRQSDAFEKHNRARTAPASP